MSDDFKNLVNGLYDLLLPITDSELRRRAVKSALLMVGDDPGIVDQRPPRGGGGADAPSGADEDIGGEYVLVGIRELFRTGEARFTDELARTECERMGTHGKTNHSTYLKTPGKAMTGAVKTGWTLTAPGLTAGAQLVKELAGEA